jgi:hypothetical protein
MIAPGSARTTDPLAKIQSTAARSRQFRARIAEVTDMRTSSARRFTCADAGGGRAEVSHHYLSTSDQLVFLFFGKDFSASLDVGAMEGRPASSRSGGLVAEVVVGLRDGSQLGALCGSERLARAVFGTVLSDAQDDEPFWLSVIQFFVANPICSSWTAARDSIAHQTRQSR